MDLTALSSHLHRYFGADAAQHALLGIVERGWHLDEGANNPWHYAVVSAKRYRIDEARRLAYQVPYGTLVALPTQLRRVIAREAIEAVDGPTILRGLGFTYRDRARAEGVAVGTIRSRTSRRRNKR